MEAPDPQIGVSAPGLAERVLVLSAAPGSVDDPATRALADSDLSVRTVADVAELGEELERGTGALFVAAATLAQGEVKALAAALAADPRLARLPVFVLGGASGRRIRAIDQLAAIDHVTVLDSPPSERTIVAAARAALRENQRQTYVRVLLGRIEEAERREERLLAVLGHELRNPLGVITTALSLMERLEGEEGPTARYRHMIERQVGLLTRRIDELLDPATGQPERAREWPQPARRERRSRRRTARPKAPVLVVEDDPDAREALAELLGLWGYQVEDAGSGEEALEKAAERQPAIALVDLDLPGIDGFEVARKLREAKKDRLLIAMSGYGQAEDRQRSFAAGFDRHLVKPVDPGRLAQLLETPTARGAA
jgi:CheY-like chemotaxis protein